MYYTAQPQTAPILTPQSLYVNLTLTHTECRGVRRIRDTRSTGAANTNPTALRRDYSINITPQNIIQRTCQTPHNRLKYRKHRRVSHETPLQHPLTHRHNKTELGNETNQDTTKRWEQSATGLDNEIHATIIPQSQEPKQKRSSPTHPAKYFTCNLHT